jgi:hypothetical protein
MTIAHNDAGEAPAISRASRPILRARAPGIERLTDGLPCDPEDREAMRQLAVAITTTISRWQIDRAKRNALARGRGGAS